MALRNIPEFPLIRDRFQSPADGSEILHLLDDPDKAVAAVIAVAPGDQIDYIGIHLVSKTGSPMPSFFVGVEGISTSVQGNPTGSYLNGIDNATAARSASTSASTLTAGELNWVPLANPYRNTSSNPILVALTLRVGSGQTFDGSHKIEVMAGIPGQFKEQCLPYVGTCSGSGTWSPARSIPAISARNAAGELVGDTSGILAFSSDGWDSSSTSTLYRGNVWNVEFGCRLSAVNISCFPTTPSAFRLRVFVNDELIDNVALDSDSVSYADDSTLGGAGLITLPITPTELEPGDVVRAVLEPTAGSAFPSFISFTDSADRLRFTRGLDIKKTAGPSTLSWTDDDTMIFCVIPVINEVDFFSGSVSGTSSGSVTSKVTVPANKTSYLATFFVPDLSSSTGAGLSGLSEATSGLSAFYMRSNAIASEEIELVELATLGEFTSGGIKAIDPTNMPGWYQLGVPDDVFAWTASSDEANSAVLSIKGAEDMAPVNIEFTIDPTHMSAKALEPSNTTLADLTYAERLWYAAQWVLGKRTDDRDSKVITLFDSENNSKASATYTDVDGTVTVPRMTLS